MAEEVTEGVYQLRVPIPDNPLEYVNVYLLRGGEGALIIDTGWPSQEALEALERQLGELGLGVGDLAQIVVTHGHGDHFGLAGRLRQLSGAPILMHEADAPRQGQGPAWHGAAGRDWLRRNGMPQEAIAQLQGPHGPAHDLAWLVAPDHLLGDGDVIAFGDRRLELIWTPGHSAGHLCIYDREAKVLFSGDHILPVITPNVSLSPFSSGNPLRSFLASLEKVSRLEVSLVLPAHEHVFSDLAGRVQEILDHHRQRIGELLESLGEAEKSAYQIAMGMPWTGLTGIVQGDELPISEQRGAVGETLAHLKVLCQEGQVERLSYDEVDLYRKKTPSLS